jgi:hypothetical protein
MDALKTSKAKSMLSKKSNAESIIIPNFKLYYKAKVKTDMKTKGTEDPDQTHAATAI